jgi:hypothetical protein
MSVINENLKISQYVDTDNKLKEELEDENICDICFANTKNDLLKCKECSNSICFNCFNTSPLKSLGFESIDNKEKFEDGEGHLFHIQNCFFCRTKNYYRISNFEKRELNILTNNIAKCYKTMIGRYEEIFKDIRETNNQTKSNSKTKFMDKTISYILIREDNNRLISQIDRYEKLEENFLKMKDDFDKLKKDYNENVKDYNNLVNQTTFLNKAYKEISIGNQYICNQRDYYKNAYINGINEIKSKNKNKNLDKFIDNKLKELDKQTTEDEVNIEIKF